MIPPRFILLFIISLTLFYEVQAADGKCGSANNTIVVSMPTDNTTYCAQGVVNSLKVVGPDFLWICLRNGSGVNDNCKAHFTKQIYGICGKARHQNLTTTSIMTDNNQNGTLCLYGTPSVVNLVQSQFQWNCSGTGGAVQVSCIASYTPYSCSGHSVGDLWTNVVNTIETINYCPYGNGNATFTETLSLNLKCGGSVATVISSTVVNTTKTGKCDTVPKLATLSVLGNWDSDPSMGGFSSVQRVRNTSIYFDPLVRTPRGQAAAQIIVEQGDDPINSSGERAEVLNPYNVTTRSIARETVDSGVVFYGATYKFPVGFGGLNYGSSWSIILQLHGPDAYGLSPSVAIAAGAFVAGGSPGFMVDGTGGFLPNGTHGSNPAFYFSQIDSEPMYYDRWVEFIMRVRFSVYTDGEVILWRRNEGEKGFRLAINVTGATLQTINGTAVGLHYWKQGLYRNKNSNRTDTHHMGPYVRANTFEDVEMAAYGTNYGTTYYPPDSDTFASSTSTATTSSSTTTTTANTARSTISTSTVSAPTQASTNTGGSTSGSTSGIPDGSTSVSGSTVGRSTTGSTVGRSTIGSTGGSATGIPSQSTSTNAEFTSTASTQLPYLFVVLFLFISRILL